MNKYGTQKPNNPDKGLSNPPSVRTPPGEFFLFKRETLLPAFDYEASASVSFEILMEGTWRGGGWVGLLIICRG